MAVIALSALLLNWTSEEKAAIEPTPEAGENGLLVLPEGLLLRAQLENAVIAARASEGEIVQARLVRAVTYNGRVILPLDTRFRGRVEIARRRKWHEPMELFILFREVILPNGRVEDVWITVARVGGLLKVVDPGFVTLLGTNDCHAWEFIARACASAALIGFLAGQGVGQFGWAWGGIAGAAVAAVGGVTLRSSDFQMREGRELWLQLGWEFEVNLEELGTPTPPPGSNSRCQPQRNNGT